jgi:hypothetical protein
MEKEKFMNDWFLNQHFSKEELEKMWNWKQISNSAKAVEVDGVWIGFHVEDTNHEVDLVEMTTQNQCENWLSRLGFDVI